MEELKKKRTQLKKAITAIFRVINAQDPNFNNVKVRIEKLDNIFVRYEELQDELDILCVTEDDLHKEDIYRDEMNEMYFQSKAIWSSLSPDNGDDTELKGAAANDQFDNQGLTMSIQALTQQQAATTTLLQTITAAFNPVSNNQPFRDQPSNNSEIRLPTIQIPDFDGNLSNWIRFKDLFSALVDSKQGLSGVEKLEYLHTKLKGEAASIIKHLTPTNDNYSVAWRLVKEKYDKPERIRDTYFELLFNQQSIKSGTLGEIRQFYNNVNESYNALRVLSDDVDSWDPILLFLIAKKLDQDNNVLWIRELKATETPTFRIFLSFLEERVNELESLNKSSATPKYQKQGRMLTMAATTQSCPLCAKDHLLYGCQQFKSLDVSRRRDVVRRNGLCFNCLREKHFSKDCKSGACRTCNLKHNTMLHMTNDLSSSNTHRQQITNETPTSVNVNSNQHSSHTTTLLPTAIIMVRDKNSTLQPCRALIDSGAQSTLISESCVQRLGLARAHDRTLLYGVGSSNPNYTRGKVQMEMYAEKTNKTIGVLSLCLSNLTQYIPNQTILNNELNFFDNLQLADPGYNKRNRIDVILGADVFTHCILDERIPHPSGSPTAVSTIFGWVIMGNVGDPPEQSTFVAHVYTGLDEQLQRFWETEECGSQKRFLGPEEEMAEKHFRDHVQRLPDGRYMVRLPFGTDAVSLGESKIAAMRRLESMERKFVKEADLKAEYHRFLDEYETLSHMEVSPSEAVPSYYLPHHGVLKPSSTTTKLRVVFDASCKSSNSLSLNDHLLVGPTVQNELYTILLNFRKFEIGFTADVEKMYRQVLIHPDDRQFQCILWRTSSSEPANTYQLKTVTYGTAAAPFLATRTLQQVAFDNSSEFPLASQEIVDKFYVDDYMSCAPDVDAAISLRATVCSILSQSGFHLRKWSSNSQRFQDVISPQDRAFSSEMVIDYSETVKTLGLLWNTTTDSFQYSVCFQELPDIISKRRVLSDISKIYDPIGWLSPVVISLKIFMQKLWLRGVNWDQDLSKDLKAEWIQLQTNIQHIKDLQIPRWFGFAVGDRVELHGFSDSSEVAYAAAIYIRIIKPNGSISSCLLTAKTRVAPIKQITLPRLELCAAHLMTKLMAKVRNILQIDNVPAFGWTDSMVVLAWIREHPRRWKTFIANRTSYIINNMPASQWRHIASKSNPADLATRGISCAGLNDNMLWWQGPQMLQDLSDYSQSPTIVPDDVDLEERKVIATVASVDDTDIFDRYSDFIRLLRITALILRFVNNCIFRDNKKTGFITTSALSNALVVLVKRSQQMSFGTEILTIRSNKSLSTGHKLAGLTPFIDNNGVLRVGGRLENANINYDQKHPYILHKNNALTRLLVAHYHIKYLHAGTRQLQYLLSLKYWIPDVSSLIKRTVYKCTTCMRYRQKPFQQRMGDLPSYRVQAGSTFVHVGVDFAGPMNIKTWKGRGSKTYKCWIAVFVCLNTKAIHLETVTELSTAAFLASLRRFTSRRGKPIHIYSDNGSNFVGCARELKELYEFLSSTHQVIYNEMSNQQIQWHFIPPSAPNFGGIWEAGVKSVKFHLRRVLGNSSVTYEELSTLLCQIECCLNSRPLCLKFEGDMDPLTPAHFLILRPMSSVPDENLTDININRLTRWQYTQHLVQQFWTKWSKEYLCQLQRRPKWFNKLQNLQIDDMVLIKEENLPPTQWLMGRITATHPGKDGIVRVVTIRTKNGIMKRPASKLCPLFLDD